MPSSSVARFSELRLVLEPEHGELVRAFVREAALAEAVPASVASLVADDAVDADLPSGTVYTGRRPRTRPH
jgi:hypothetical protein